MPNKGLQAEARHLLHPDWLTSQATVSPVIHSPVDGKHPQSELRGEGAHLVSSINDQLFNNASRKKEKGTSGYISQ